MKKTILIILTIVALTLIACSSPADDAVRADISDSQGEMDMEGIEVVPINMDTSSFEFEGYGPGKSHIGTFNYWEGSLYLDDEKIVGGEGIVQASSVDTGIEGLDSHLLNDDFFNSEMYPTIEFKSTSLSDDLVLTGDLTFRGVTKSVSFPVVVSEEGISADFILDMSAFEVPKGLVDKEVRVAFEFMK